jgi:nitrate reductase beta subunit
MDRIKEAASAPSDPDVYPAHLDIILDPNDPEIKRIAADQGIAPNMVAAAQRSSVYALIKEWRLALPLHPEFRTLPMVWYIPPLSPVTSQVEPSRQSDAIDRMRIPMTYLANLLTAGDKTPVRMALKRLAAIRNYMRIQRVEKRSDTDLLDAVGLDTENAMAIYRLLALANINDRFVLPTRPVLEGQDNFTRQGSCGFNDAF